MSSKRKQDFDDHYVNVQHVGSFKNIIQEIFPLNF